VLFQFSILKNKDIYIINFHDLDIGEYDFKFILDNVFFEKFDNSEIKDANIKAEVKLIKHQHTFELDFDLSGFVTVQCDRCLDDFKQHVTYKTDLFVEFGEKSSDLSDADTRITIASNEIEIVLDKHLYDYAHLSIPYKNVHPDENKCNMSIINRIEELNTKQEEVSDPRWDKLKTLMN